MDEVTGDLNHFGNELETIANLTEGADETIVYMKDSTTSAQKSASPGVMLNWSTPLCPLFECLLGKELWLKYYSNYSPEKSIIFFFFLDLYFKKSASMLDDVVRFEKTIIAQEEQML